MLVYMGYFLCELGLALTYLCLFVIFVTFVLYIGLLTLKVT